ncbi:rab11 family-interacting protein 4-like isoform X2 [Ruditapes philippinarum]|uniref:rab11 family-interacting protein 4-like isoform X2 n=1 Tax=Ruditapes philippinarum TaxID=129788 RepID=UPI00295B42B2|nr:rab11 family-interacting protein 4-like isoform X2 [Ruditapes philippinarum]
MEVDFTEKIKSVFDVCDTEGTGYITVDHLKNLAKEHFGADSDEEVIGIIQLLDPEGKGKVSFTDFCQGVQQILEVQASKQSTPTNSGNHSDFINSFHFESEQSPPEAQDTSEASAFTFNEYDTNTDEDGNQLLIDFSTPETSRRNLLPSYGHSSGRSSATSRTDEENFEDYGVVDLESDSSDANLSCDSCHRSRRSPRSNRQRGPNRRISSAAYASQLARGLRSPNANEDIYDDIDGSFQELTDRIKSLEKQLVKVNDDRSKEDGVKIRYKDENSILIKRIHTMEEQLKDMECKSDDRVREEQRKYQEMVNKHGIENEKMDYLTLRLQTFETENERLKTDVVRLKNENDRLRMDKMEVSDRLAAMEEDFNKVSAEYNEVMSKFDREQEITGNKTSGKLLDELQKELEDLRKFKIDCEHKHSHIPRTPSLSDSNGFSFNAELAKLKETLWLEWRDAAQANKHLAEENEELNAQLLAQAVKEGRHMLQEGNSLAEELDHMTKEELMKSLKEQQDVNFRLRQYVDKMLLTILEKNPAILEVQW